LEWVKPGTSSERRLELGPTAIRLAERDRDESGVIEKPGIRRPQRARPVGRRARVGERSILVERPRERVLAVDIGPRGFGRSSDVEGGAEILIVVEVKERELTVVEPTTERRKPRDDIDGGVRLIGANDIAAQGPKIPERRTQRGHW